MTASIDRNDSPFCVICGKEKPRGLRKSRSEWLAQRTCGYECRGADMAQRGVGGPTKRIVTSPESQAEAIIDWWRKRGHEVTVEIRRGQCTDRDGREVPTLRTNLVLRATP